MSKKKTTETDATPVQATAQAPAAPAAGATAGQVTAITASLLTSPRYASCVKDPREQDRVIGIAISIANKINQVVARG